MKLISVYTESHRILKDKWFLSTLQDDFEKEIYYHAFSGEGSYLKPDWSNVVKFKIKIIIDKIKGNWGNVFLYSDVDIQFFSPIKEYILKAIHGRDIVCQQDDPARQLCTGFVVLRCNASILNLYEETLIAVGKEGRDQLAFNRIIRTKPNIKYGYFPKTFFGGGTFSRKIWQPGMKLYIPRKPIMHHANFTIGIENKILQLEYVRNIVNIRQKKSNLLPRCFSKKFRKFFYFMQSKEKYVE